jgi:hypothetical protein
MVATLTNAHKKARDKVSGFLFLVDRIIELSDLKLGFVEVFEYLEME